MNKQTKMWLGVALVGVAGYMLWKQSKQKPAAASFVTGQVGPRTKAFASAATVIDGRMSATSKDKFTMSDF